MWNPKNVESINDRRKGTLVYSPYSSLMNNKKVR